MVNDRDWEAKFGEPETVKDRGDEIAEFEACLRSQHLARERLLYDDPIALAAYIEDGGEIDVALRWFLAERLRRRKQRQFPSPRGDKNERRDMEVFEAVEKIRVDMAMQAGKDGDGGFAAYMKRVSKEMPTIDAGLVRYIKTAPEFKDQDGDVEIGGIRKQYDRGRKIAKGR